MGCAPCSRYRCRIKRLPLCVTALADSISDAQQAALAVTAAISFDGAQYRRDIGHHAITRENA